MVKYAEYIHDAHAEFRIFCNVHHEVPQDIRLSLSTVSRLFTHVILLPTTLILHMVIDRGKTYGKGYGNR